MTHEWKETFQRMYGDEQPQNKKRIIWLDQNVNNSENSSKVNQLRENKNFEVIPVTDVKTAYEEIGKHYFSYCILSGRIAEEFLDSYEIKMMKGNPHLTATMIYCSNINLHKYKKYVFGSVTTTPHAT